MRKLFMSDIHGQNNEMQELLKEAQFNPATDQIVIGGDLINRGPDSAKVVRYWKELQEKYPHNVIVIQGNHEDMLKRFSEYPYNSMFYRSGGVETAESFLREFLNDADATNEHIGWLTARPYMHQDDEYIYVHAGIDPKAPLSVQNKDDLMWMPYHPSPSGMRFSDSTSEEILQCTGGKKVIHGHTPRSYIFDDGARICCDLGAAVKETDAKLALVDLTGDRYWQYHFDQKMITSRKIARKRKEATS